MAERVERVVEVERRPEPAPASGGGGFLIALVVAVVLLIGLGYVVIQPGSDGSSVNISAPKVEVPNKS